MSSWRIDDRQGFSDCRLGLLNGHVSLLTNHLNIRPSFHLVLVTTFAPSSVSLIKTVPVICGAFDLLASSELPSTLRNPFSQTR